MGIFLDSRMHSANLDQRIPRPWESGPMSQDVVNPHREKEVTRWELHKPCQKHFMETADCEGRLIASGLDM